MSSQREKNQLSSDEASGYQFVAPNSRVQRTQQRRSNARDLINQVRTNNIFQPESDEQTAGQHKLKDIIEITETNKESQNDLLSEDLRFLQESKNVQAYNDEETFLNSKEPPKKNNLAANNNSNPKKEVKPENDLFNELLE